MNATNLVRVAIWPDSHDALDWLIKALTHGLGCHAAFLLPGDIVHEAYWPVVRQRPFTQVDRRACEIYDVEFLTEEKSRVLVETLSKDVGVVRYSFLDLFRYAVNDPSKDERFTFCSRYVLHKLGTVLSPEETPLTRIPYGDWASPRDLRISPRLHLVDYGVFSLRQREVERALATTARQHRRF